MKDNFKEVEPITAEHLSTQYNRHGSSTHWALNNNAILIEAGTRGVNLRLNVDEAQRFLTWQEIADIIAEDCLKDEWLERQAKNV